MSGKFLDANILKCRDVTRLFDICFQYLNSRSEHVETRYFLEFPRSNCLETDIKGFL